jgi:8-oxo-dGTP pyrophosphatase MutT (NUDIX family)
MKLQVGVKICIINKDDKILLARRSSARYCKYKHMGGQWDIIGGRIDPGINLLDNLKREIKEETGINWKSEAKLMAAQDILVPDKHVVRLTFLGKLKSNPKVRIDHESTEYKWFSIKELKSLGSNELDKYFKMLLDKNIIK